MSIMNTIPLATGICGITISYAIGRPIISKTAALTF